MRKIVLFLLSFCIVIAACNKTVKQTLDYSISNDAAQTGVYDLYIPDTGTITMPFLVKFMSGYPQDSVKLVFRGAPNGIKITPDTITAIPTFTADFQFYTNFFTHGSYPLTLTAYTPTRLPVTYNLNVHVVPANAASMFFGALNDSNACTARTYKYSATGVNSGYVNLLTINNFGGYGTNVNVNVIFNLQNNTLDIPSQLCGNGSTVIGHGTFTETQMVIYYDASSTPTNPAESCVSVYTR